MIKKQIVDYYVKKFKASGIYLSGSRVRNKQRKNSDWDIHLVVPDNENPLSEKFDNISIDIKYIHESKIDFSVIDTPYSPAVPFDVLYRDDKLKNKLIEYENRTLARYMQGPKEWTSDELQDNKTRLQRFLEAILGTTNNNIICFRHICKFFDLALVYWFGIRSRWPIPIYEAIDVFEQEDTYFYNLITDFAQSKTNEQRAEIAVKIYNHLFDI